MLLWTHQHEAVSVTSWSKCEYIIVNSLGPGVNKQNSAHPELLSGPLAMKKLRGSVSGRDAQGSVRVCMFFGQPFESQAISAAL